MSKHKKAIIYAHKNTLLKIGFSFITCVAVSGLGLFFYQTNLLEKKKTLNSVWQPPALSKHLALFKIQLTSSQEIPEDLNTEVELQAVVTANQNISDSLKTSWILPEGVRAVDPSQLEQYWSAVNLGQTFVVKLTVTGFSKVENSVVSFMVQADQNNQERSSSALIASRPEDSLEFIAKDIRQEHMQVTQNLKRRNIANETK